MTPFSNLPCLFLSYKEPNADDNFKYLLATHPKPDNVRRVHGVEGFDSAHKMCALLAWKPKFILIDGDSRVLKPKDFFRLALEGLDMEADDSDRTSLCFSSVNSALALEDYSAGFSYGNGGIKVWSRNRVLEMKTHENAQSHSVQTQVEFCYEPWFKHSELVNGITLVNETPEQAFRAGFREGYKLSQQFYGSRNPLHAKMLTVLQCWMTMSADVDNGNWSMLGARAGFLLLTNRSQLFEEVGDSFDPSELVNSESACMEFMLLIRTCQEGIDRLVEAVDPVNFKIRTAEQAVFYKSKFPI